MIRFLQGKIHARGESFLVVLVQGVGYELWVPPRMVSAYEEGVEGSFHVYTHVRAESLELFGFSTLEDRRFFSLLLGVSGVGPRTALSVLNDGYMAGVEAVRQSDVAFFQSVPRLGKKTAQKIILELQSKLCHDTEWLPSLSTPVVREVEEALLSLGYTAAEVQPLLRKLDSQWSTEQALRWSLQQLKRA